MPRDAAGHLTAGRISPARACPGAHPATRVRRPTRAARSDDRSDVYTPDEIELIRESGRIAAGAIDAVAAAIRPGITTDELDAIAHDYLIERDAYPSTLGYRGFPKSCCTSLNEVVCHGIPDDTVLVEGDILNIDITAYKNGMHGDLNATFAVGHGDSGCCAPDRAHPRGPEPRHHGGRTGPPDQRHRTCDRVATPSASATASCATSPATASARASTPGW